MKLNQVHYLKIVFLILPLLFLAGLIVKAEMDRNHGPIWTMNIQGYDPRDILRGQYVQFQFDWNMDTPQAAACSGQSCCMCLNDSDGARHPRASLISCETENNVDLRQCTSVIRSWDNSDRPAGRFSSATPYNNNYRYYLQEDYARELQRRLNSQRTQEEGMRDQFTLQMNVTSDGRMIFHDLLINNQPYKNILN